MRNLFFYFFSRFISIVKINNLQRENLMHKDALEKEIATRKALQIELDKKLQLIRSYESDKRSSSLSRNRSKVN